MVFYASAKSKALYVFDISGPLLVFRGSDLDQLYHQQWQHIHQVHDN